MVKIWFKIFYRNSKKNWLNLLVNVFGLALGFSGLLFALLFFNDEKSYDDWNPDKNNIYKVLHIMSDHDVWGTSTAIEGEIFKEEIPEVKDYYLSSNWYDNALVTVNGKGNYTKGILEGEANFFDFFPFKIIAGNTSKFKEAKNNIAISKITANNYFGDDTAIGKSIMLHKKSYTVATVFEGNQKSYFNPKIVLQYPKKQEGNWGNFSKNLFCKITEDSNIADLEEKMDGIFTKYYSTTRAKSEGISVDEFEEKYGLKVKLEKLSNIRLHTIADEAGPEGKGNYSLILMMLGLSILLIIISCVNFINLSAASVSQRVKEVGVKKTLGLSKLKITGHYLLEIIFQSLISFILALILVELLLPYFNQFLNKNILMFNNTILLILPIFVIVLALLIGIIPALNMAKFKLVMALKGNMSRTKNGILVRNIMLGLQFLISGFFLIAAMVIYNQITFMMDKDVGFSGDKIIVVDMNDYNNRYKKYKTLKKELIKHHNIEAITSNLSIPGGGNSNSTNTSYNEISLQGDGNAVDYEYFSTLKIKIIKGRGFQEKYASDTLTNILINETFAKQLQIYDDPIGKQIQVGYDDESVKKNVIGVVNDYHIAGFEEKIAPMFFFHWNTYKWMKDYNFSTIQFKVKLQNFDETIADIEAYWNKNIEQGYPFEYQFLDKTFQKTFEKYKTQKVLFTILTIVVILIALLGLFALATLTIQQRLKEVAIRKILGASVNEIMYQLINKFVIISLIASLFLLPISYYMMQNWLNNFVYRTDIPVLPFVVTPLILVLLVVIVVGTKAFSATKLDLVHHIKVE